MLMSSDADDLVQAASARLVKTVTRVLHAGYNADYTDWQTMCICTNATDTAYISQLAAHSRTLVYISSLRNANGDVLQRGPSHPFVFGNNCTNGLATALSYALNNCAIELHKAGDDANKCICVAADDTQIYYCLSIISHLDSCLLTTDPSVHYTTHELIASIAQKISDQDVVKDAMSLCNVSYLAKFNHTNDLFLSAALKRTISDACIQGKSEERTGMLVLRRIQQGIDTAGGEYSAVARDKIIASWWDKAADVLEQMRLPPTLSFC